MNISVFLIILDCLYIFLEKKGYQQVKVDYLRISHLWTRMGMAMLPSVYFLLEALWLKNYLAVSPSIVFGICHTVIFWINYKV